MGWGILPDHRTPKPPGTVLLDDLLGARNLEADSPESSGLKKQGHVVLQPQPCDSPNDPLNWSMKVKLSVYITIVTTMVSIGGVLGMLSTAGRILGEKFHVKYSVVIQNVTAPGTGSTMGALFLAAPLAAVFGKRVLIFFGVLGITIDMFVGIFADSLTYYRTLSLFNGIWMAPVELLIAPITTDLIFVHQRGRFMAVSSVIRDVGSDASHIISGNIIAKLGVKYLYIVSFAVFIILTLCNFFLLRETTFVRPREPEPGPEPSESTTASSSGVLIDGKKEDIKRDDGFLGDDKKAKVTETEVYELTPVITQRKPGRVVNDSAIEPKHTFRQDLRLFRGRITHRSFKRSFFQPFPIMVVPTVIFATVIHGTFLTWIISSTIVQHQILLFPPYNVKPDVLSYLTLPGSVVNLITALCAGTLSDWLIQFCARHNNGIYEPEFRLFMLIPATICTSAGFAILGPLYHDKASVWKIVVAGLCFHMAGPFASSGTIPYIFDTMQNASTEAFVAVSFFRHVFILLAQSFIPLWLEHKGPLHLHQTLLVANICISCCAIPMYFFGKRLRGMVHRNAFFRRACETHN